MIRAVSGAAAGRVTEWKRSYKLETLRHEVGELASADGAAIGTEVLARLGITGIVILEGRRGLAGRRTWFALAGLTAPVIDQLLQ